MLHDRAVDPGEDRALGGDRDDLTVPRKLHHARLTQERGRVRRAQEGLALAQADDELHLMARADEEPGMVAVDDDEREMPFELSERAPDRLDEIALG